MLKLLGSCPDGPTHVEGIIIDNGGFLPEKNECKVNFDIFLNTF
jgi:hypothetical protein